jgi:hypothetical protein
MTPNVQQKNGIFQFNPLIKLTVAVFTGALAATTAAAASINTQWTIEIAVQKNAPTPDAMAKAVVSAASFLGSITVGNGQDSGNLDKTGFTLRSRLTATAMLSRVFDNLSIERQSSGRFVNGQALTSRYSEKRGRSDELLMQTNATAKRYEFFKGGKPTGTKPMSVMASDLTSAPYAFIGKPAPTGPAFLAFTDGRSIRQVNFTSSAETVKVSGKEVKAVRLSGSTSAGPLDLWMRAADGYPIRMRVSLGSKYGATLDQKAKEIPAELVLF